MPAEKADAAHHYPLPQTSGSHTRQPDGSLVLQKPKAALADLVAAKAARNQPAAPTPADTLPE